MRKGLFSKNGFYKILATSAVFALVAVTVPSHISSLSVVHADNDVSVNSIDDEDSTVTLSDSETDCTSDNTASDTLNDNNNATLSDKSSLSSDKTVSKSKDSSANKSAASDSTKKSNIAQIKFKQRSRQKKNNQNNNQEPKHYKPIIGKTITVTMTHLQKKLNKISSDLKNTQNKASHTKKVIYSKKKQLSSINILKDDEKKQTNCVTASDVFEPSQSLKSYAKQYDSSLSIYLNQEVSSAQNNKDSSDASILPDFEKISSLMDTVSIKKGITNSKKNIKSAINKNTAKIKSIHKKIKIQKQAQKAVAKYVVVSVNSKNIFEPSNVSTKTLKKALEGTNLETLAPAFVKAEKKYGINAIAMTSIAALESGWGESKRAIRDNNLTGLGVYSDSAKGINADTKEKNILMTAERLATHYSKPGQIYYNGTGFDGVNKKYSVSKTWGWKCENIAFRIMDKIANPELPSLS